MRSRVESESSPETGYQRFYSKKTQTHSVEPEYDIKRWKAVNKEIYLTVGLTCNNIKADGQTSRCVDSGVPWPVWGSGGSRAPLDAGSTEHDLCPRCLWQSCPPCGCTPADNREYFQLSTRSLDAFKDKLNLHWSHSGQIWSGLQQQKIYKIQKSQQTMQSCKRVPSPLREKKYR